MKTRNLAEYTEEVNKLEAAKCAKINASGTRLFPAVPTVHREHGLKYYFEKGFNTREAVKAMWEEQSRSNTNVGG